MPPKAKAAATSAPASAAADPIPLEKLEKLEGNNFKCNTIGLKDAIRAVQGCVKKKSPKPILQNVFLTIDPDNGSTVWATDLETGIRVNLLGCSAGGPLRLVVEPFRLLAILDKTDEAEVYFTAEADKLTMTTTRYKFEFPAEDPNLFPDIPDEPDGQYQEFKAGDLRKLIRRTRYATDVESTRYALGGCLLELTDTQATMVGTDGRRLARQVVPCATVPAAEVRPSAPMPVLPLKVLNQLLARLGGDDEATIKLFVNVNDVYLTTPDTTLYGRLVEGRFPRYQDVFPANADIRVKLDCEELKTACELASVATSEESRGVDVTLAKGKLRFAAQAADRGSADVNMPVFYDGPKAEFTIDPRYLIDALATLESDTSLDMEVIDGKNAIIFKIEGDGFTYVVMPLTRDR